jgi:aminoglycoside/choline kinase family phosphotransferase
LDADLSVLIQRDYHAENLLWLPERQGVARIGLLDFQDAMLGHPVYDLVSVLQDARRDVNPVVAEQTRQHFEAQSGMSSTSFDLAYAVLGLQRNLRILGVFARLCLRDDKPHYVDFMPRVWGHIQTNLTHPALSEVADIISRDLPVPTPDNLSLLKSKRGAWAGR